MEFTYLAVNALNNVLFPTWDWLVLAIDPDARCLHLVGRQSQELLNCGRKKAARRLTGLIIRSSSVRCWQTGLFRCYWFRNFLGKCSGRRFHPSTRLHAQRRKFWCERKHYWELYNSWWGKYVGVDVVGDGERIGKKFTQSPKNRQKSPSNRICTRTSYCC